MRIVTAAACAAAFAALAACATVTRGTSEQLQFDSVPTGAEVRTIIQSPCDGPCPAAAEGRDPGPLRSQVGPELGPACVTPCTVQVRRNDKLIATFSKPGYKPQTIEVGTRIAGAGAVGLAGNVLIGGVVGVGVDAASGATLEHFPNPVVATLEPEGPPRAARPKKAPAKKSSKEK